MNASPNSVLSQEAMIDKLYRDFARLAGEIAIDRCRSRVLLGLVKERLSVSDEELNQLFQAEVQQNLEKFCLDITAPMLGELESVEVIDHGPIQPGQSAGGCGSSCGCG